MISILYSTINPKLHYTINPKPSSLSYYNSCLNRIIQKLIPVILYAAILVDKILAVVTGGFSGLHTAPPASPSLVMDG